MPEIHNIEWKESWRDEYLKWICGFANAVFRCGYIEAWGRGTIKMIEDCTKAGLPKPSYIMTARAFG